MYAGYMAFTVQLHAFHLAPVRQSTQPGRFGGQQARPVQRPGLLEVTDAFSVC
jgi:hypothetical protein